MNKNNTSIQAAEDMWTKQQANSCSKMRMKKQYKLTDDDEERLSGIPNTIFVRPTLRSQCSDISLDFAFIDCNDDTDSNNYNHNGVISSIDVEKINVAGTATFVASTDLTEQQLLSSRRSSHRSSLRSSRSSIDSNVPATIHFYNEKCKNTTRNCSNNTAEENKIMKLSMSSRTTRSSQIRSSIDDLFRSNSIHCPSPKMPIRKLSSDCLVGKQ